MPNQNNYTNYKEARSQLINKIKDSLEIPNLEVFVNDSDLDFLESNMTYQVLEAEYVDGVRLINKIRLYSA